MLQPGMGNDTKPLAFWSFGLDNGRFARPDTWDAGNWLEWLAGLRKNRERCLFATAPDVVSDWNATVELSLPYLPTIRQLGFKAALVAQGGWRAGDVDPDAFDVLFIGDSDDAWKFSEHGGYAAARWARTHGKATHMGRVNSGRRLLAMQTAGFDSVDGTYLAFGPDVNHPRLMGWLDAANRQPSLEQAA